MSRLNYEKFSKYVHVHVVVRLSLKRVVKVKCFDYWIKLSMITGTDPLLSLL